MPWNTDILEPTIELIPTGVSDAFKEPTHAFLRVSISFVGGAYPDHTFETESRSVFDNVLPTPAEFLAFLEDKVNKWKAKHDIINSKQAQINSWVSNQTWGV